MMNTVLVCQSFATLSSMKGSVFPCHKDCLSPRHLSLSQHVVNSSCENLLHNSWHPACCLVYQDAGIPGCRYIGVFLLRMQRYSKIVGSPHKLSMSNCTLHPCDCSERCLHSTADMQSKARLQTCAVMLAYCDPSPSSCL